MSLQDAGQFGTAEDINTLIDLFSSMMTTVLPILGCCLIIYVGTTIYKRHKNKKERLKKQKELTKQVKKQQKEITKNQVQNPNNAVFNNTDAMMKKLDNTEQKYYDSRFDSLALEFDENGKAK